MQAHVNRFKSFRILNDLMAEVVNVKTNLINRFISLVSKLLEIPDSVSVRTTVALEIPPFLSATS